MATIVLGVNLVAANGPRLRSRLWKFLAGNWSGPSRNNIPIHAKAGIPASNTAADDPGSSPSFILDTTNSAVYFCNARTNSTTFTLVKLTA